MKILLVDVDSKIPNLALMKISSHHQNKGDSVKLKRIGYNGYKEGKRIFVSGIGYDKVYVSTIFSTNHKAIRVSGCENVEYGGSGEDLKKRLPDEIDDCCPDYGIYPENKRSYGFITRGCIRTCWFCQVPEKEGRLCFYRDPFDIIHFKETEFLDNNFLAYENAVDILKQLIKRKIRFRFNQGLDIRLVTDEIASLLAQSRYIGDYIFAFDSISIKDKIAEKTKLLKKYIKDWKIKFYIYCNAKMDPQKEVISRIEWCKENKCLPYLMRDRNCYESELTGFYSNLAAWCNQPNFFKKTNFEQFMKIRTGSVDTQRKHINIYKS